MEKLILVIKILFLTLTILFSNLLYASSYIELFGKKLPLPDNSVVRLRLDDSGVKVYSKESGIALGLIDVNDEKCNFIDGVISGEINYDAKIIKDAEYITKNGKVLHFYRGFFPPEDNPETFWIITDCHTFIDIDNKLLFEIWSQELYSK